MRSKIKQTAKNTKKDKREDRRGAKKAIREGGYKDDYTLLIQFNLTVATAAFKLPSNLPLVTAGNLGARIEDNNDLGLFSLACIDELSVF